MTTAKSIEEACLDEAIDRRPQAHAFYDAHVDWMPLDETLTIARP